jgi:hypothetical protein
MVLIATLPLAPFVYLAFFFLRTSVSRWRYHKAGDFNKMLIDDIGLVIQDSLDPYALREKSLLTGTWNALLERSTTKPEDLHTVLTNPINFNAVYLVQSKDAGERMNAMARQVQREAGSRLRHSSH